MAENQALQKSTAEAPEGAERTTTRKVFIPRVDIFETADALYLVADMPGVDENSIDVMLEKRVLTIRGKQQAQAPDGYSLVYGEYDVGDFEREFTISDEVDRQGIQAAMQNGVLKVTLPKARHVVAHKIPVAISN